MPFLLSIPVKILRLRCSLSNTLFKNSQRYFTSRIIQYGPTYGGALHSISTTGPNGVQTRCLRRFSSVNDTIPLSPAQKETIYALSTPPGRAGIAVVRISGPEVSQVYHRVVKPTVRGTSGAANRVHHTDDNRSRTLPEPWRMHRCSVLDPETKQILDEGLAVYFAGMCTAPKCTGFP